MVSAPAFARRVRQSRAAGASRSSSPSVIVPSQRIAPRSSRRARNWISLQLSSSHHWRSSTEITRGRSAAREATTWATPSYSRQASAGSAVGSGSASPGKRCRRSGRSLATSVSHSGAVAARPGASRPLRRASTIGANGTAVVASYPRPRSTVAPSATTVRRKSSTRRDLPMPASPSTRTILRMSFAAAFQALTRTGHSSARPMRLASSKGAWAYHSRRSALGAPSPASASIRRPSASRALEGSQPVSRSMAARYSASPSEGGSPVARQVPGFDRQPRRLLGESVAMRASRSARSAASRHRRRSMASRASVARTAAYRRMQAGPGLRHPFIELWCMSDGESGEKPRDVDRRRGFGVRLRQTQELGHVAAHRLRQADHPSVGVHQASERVTQLLQRLTQ